MVGVRGLLAFYGSTPAYVPVLDAEGWADVQPELNRLSKTGAFGAMFELITDDMLATLAVRGTPEECAEKMQTQIAAAGVNHMILAITDRALVKALMGRDVEGVPDIDTQLQLVHDRVMPAFA